MLHGAEIMLDVSTLTVRSAGRFLSVIRESFLNANAFVERAKSVAATVANALVPKPSFATVPA